MAKKTIREVARETSQELGQAFTSFKGFVKKRVRAPPKQTPSVAFAVVPPQFIQMPRRVARPRRIKRRKRR